MLKLFFFHFRWHRLVAVVLFFALLTIVACGGGSNSVTEWEDKTPGQSYEDFSDLPECAAKLEGEKVYVEETAYKCEDGEWVKSKESSKKEHSNEDNDGEGDNDDEGEPDSELSADSDNSGQHGRVVIDESKSIIKPYLEKSVEGCFMSGLDFSWKTVDLDVEQSTFKYEFVDDTLVLHSGNSLTEYGSMYVGGKNGNLNGTWQSTLCIYNSSAGKSTCYKPCSEVKKMILRKYGVSSEDELDDEDLEDYRQEYSVKRNTCHDDDEIVDVTLKISGDDITVITTPRETEEKEFTDYMNSEYISDLYELIYEGSHYAPSVYGIINEDANGVKKYRRLANIKERSRTKTALTFEVNEGTLLSVTVNKVNVDRKNEKAEISMTVASDESSCKLNHIESRVNKGDCKSDNLGKFNETSKIESADGTVYKMVTYMEDSNKGDFDACVGKILEGLAKGNGNESGGDDYYCSEYSSSYYDCVNTFADYGDSYVEEYCGVYRSYMDEYCVGSLTKTAASTNKLSKRKFKQLQRAHINGLETLLK